jgi:pimeloyl-ACP methyl ester carboxylesterase
MATYVLVHGGGHGGWCYQKVTRLLRGQGHEVYAPSLTGLGERSHLATPQTDLDTHIRDIASLLHYEDLTDVILVGHSYGGMVITGAADRAGGRVGRLVYLDAANPKDGESLADLSPQLIMAARQMARVIDGVDMVLLPELTPVDLMYGVTDPGDVAWMTERLTPHPWKCFDQPLKLTGEQSFAAVPQYHIVCTSTLATRDPNLIAGARAAGRLWDIDTGHDLMITEPERVADALLQIAELFPRVRPTGLVDRYERGRRRGLGRQAVRMS